MRSLAARNHAAERNETNPRLLDSGAEESSFAARTVAIVDGMGDPMRTAPLGSFGEASSGVVDAERVNAYLAATNDSHPAYRSGLVPPLFGAVMAGTISAEAAVCEVVPAEALPMLVHAAEDAFFLHPLTAGERVATRAQLFNARVTPMGTALCFRSVTEDADRRSVLDVYSTYLVRGLRSVAEGGPDAPGHALARERRADTLGRLALRVDDDQSVRYADASGDENPIHLDLDVARSVGMPGVILHGMCTLALCGQAVFTLAGGAPETLRRLAASFTRPVFLGSDVVVSACRVGETRSRRAVGFEAVSRRKAVVKDGLAEFASEDGDEGAR